MGRGSWGTGGGLEGEIVRGGGASRRRGGRVCVCVCARSHIPVPTRTFPSLSVTQATQC